MKQLRAFTIVELLVVIVVLGILLSISTFAYTQVRKEAIDTDREAKIVTFSRAFEKYYEKNGEYPSVRSIVNNYPENTGALVASKLGIKEDDLKMPKMPSGATNPFQSGSTPSNGYVSYIAQSTDSAENSSCQTSATGGCDSYVLMYNKENSDIVSVNSDRGIRIAIESPPPPPPPPAVSSVSTGGLHTCATVTNNEAYCWGSNNYGELTGSGTFSLDPRLVSTSGGLSGKTIKTISNGLNHTCAIASDDQAYCWGANQYGRLGNGSTSNSSVPVAVNTAGVLAGKTIKSISPGFHHSCAIASDDQAYCWGRNTYGELGNNTTTTSSVPVAVNTAGALNGKTVKSISASTYATCAIASDDQAYCWGYNTQGQLGNNSTTNSSVPVAVNNSGVLAGKTIKSLDTSFNNACAVASDNNAYCWGFNLYGQLGNNSTTNSSVPVAVNNSGVLAGKTIKSLSSGSNIACVIASDDKAYCWGRNQFGQLGNNTTTTSLVPVAVDTSGVLSGKLLSYLATDYDHVCVISSDNNVYCWGYNYYGQLGNNSGTDSSVPVTTTKFP